MGLITKTVKIKWGNKNRKYYESLGYIFTKYGDEFEVDINDLPKGSHVKVECFCDNCKKPLIWRYNDYNRCIKKDGKTYCNKCSKNLYGIENRIKNKIIKGNVKSFYDWCIEHNRRDVLDRWDYELNGCSPKDVLYTTTTLRWFKCNKHKSHHSELKNIGNFTRGHNDSMNCKQCNSIAQYILDNFPNKKLEEVWNYEKNGDLVPWDINKGSKIKIWIFCQEKDYHRSYETIPDSFCKGRRCSFCAGKKVHPLDSLKQYVIDNYSEEFFNIVWSDKNTIDPTTLTPNSSKKVWWNCPEDIHESFERDCKSSKNYNYRCPNCIRERKQSMIEEETKKYLEVLDYKVNCEFDCSLLLYNPKTKQPLPFDNEIILENGKHLIIEVHGEQHYKLLSKNHRYFKKGQTPEEYLHQRKLYDRYKRIKCIQAGYYYLEIPYTAFDKKDIYKKLIDNKIKEILNNK